MHDFVGIDLSRESVPYTTTLLKLRRRRYDRRAPMTSTAQVTLHGSGAA
jgi:hypothetical protein